MTSYTRAPQRLVDRAAQARTWLFDVALPLWGSRGLDAEGGFAELLGFTGAVAPASYKRLRVQGRQVYVFSHAHTLGFPDALRAAEAGWEFMERHFVDPATGAWARRCDRAGAVTDPTIDLYDQAFGLLASAWRFRTTGDEAALDRARSAVQAIDAQLPGPGGEGWWSEPAPAGQLLQNPHMHLLEAAIALHDASGADEFALLAARLLELFHTRLFDPRTGTVAEYFAADWQRRGDLGRVIEPGHHYEWTWLLHHAERIVPGASRHAGELFAFAEAHGTGSRSGSVVAEVLDDGTLRSGATRTWAVTEAIKAHLARFEFAGELDLDRLDALTDELFTQFLDRPAAGLWTDAFDDRGEPAVQHVPASTLYHVFLACAELIRIAGPAPGQA